MIAMTRMQSDSFLPSGAIVDPCDRSMPYAGQLNGCSTSLISPLSLPHSANQLSYFDDKHLNSLPPPNYAHLSSASGAPRPQQFLSPDPSPPLFRDQRSSSQSPSSFRNGSSVQSPAMAPTSHPGTGSPLPGMSSQSAVVLLQRREEYSRRLLESWQAERAHLEANRARAEEVFKEERDMMDEERMIWIAERAKFEQDIQEWKQRAELAEHERDHLAQKLKSLQGDVGTSSVPMDGAADAPPKGAMRGGSSGSPRTSNPSAAKVQSPSDNLSPRSMPHNTLLGSTMPDSKPFVPLDPRMQGPSPGTASPAAHDHIPSIDVHEVIPGLEGIRLKAPAIQKSTFMDGMTSTPPAESRSSPPPSDKESPKSQSKTPAERTQAALQAPEAHRLTMHAGHTPNHSISLSRRQTTVSTFAPNTADSSGNATPRQSVQVETVVADDVQLQSQLTTGENAAAGQPEDRDAQHDPQVEETAAFEPSEEDPELKGPLCLKNRPAADEIFLRKVSEKLEQVRDQDARPSVLDDTESIASFQESVQAGPSHAVGEDSRADRDDTPADIEAEIPLKIKKTSNFGQPLGQLGP
ncbi:hypothetical protein F4780DRAFT_566180 [Xylariomycetidae sp. FL0641]|nr:hypothetical protein F4780DRAFT_566180 [Xylariomycetidae sp. FL0641]